MAVSRWQRRFHSNQRAGYPNLELLIPTPLNPQGTPLPLTLYPQLTPLLIPSPNWLNEPTPSLITQGSHLPFPQENDIIATLHQLNEAREGLADEVLLEWALDMLCSLEDWRWLWNLEPVTTPLLSLTLQNCQTPLSYAASNINPWTMYALTASNTSAPSVKGPLPDTLSTPAQCAPAQSVESSVMWAPVVQLQPRLTLPLSLPEWVTLEDFESVPQGYKRGNVMVEEPPTSFLLFSLVNCTLLSHFSFSDFITVAFPDLARDLDSQI